MYFLDLIRTTVSR